MGSPSRSTVYFTCSSRSMNEKPSCRIWALAARKVRARFIFWKSSSGTAAPVSQWRANRSSASRFRSEERETQLPHLGVGGAEGAGPFHLLEKLFRYRCAGLPVAREQVQRLAFPAPVFHDLRGQFHKIPSHAGAGQRADFHAAQQVVQQVAELVKDGL